MTDIAVQPETIQHDADIVSREQVYRRNFRFFLADFVLFTIALNLIGPTTVVPDFVRKLTSSEILIGFSGQMFDVGWLMPQLFIARWLVRDGRAATNKLAHLPGYNADTDRRRARRDLTVDELARLITAAERGSVWTWRAGMSHNSPTLGIDGPDRAMFYRLAAGTGFRASELRSLTLESFDLDGDVPTVTVRAGYSKRRRDDVQPIGPELAKLLRPWLAGKRSGATVFVLPEKTAAMCRSGLVAMVNRLANLRKELQPIARTQLLLFGVSTATSNPPTFSWTRTANQGSSISV